MDEEVAVAQLAAEVGLHQGGFDRAVGVEELRPQIEEKHVPAVVGGVRRESNFFG